MKDAGALLLLVVLAGGLARAPRRSSSSTSPGLPPLRKPKGWEGEWPPPEGEDNLGRHPLPAELDR